MTTIEEMRKEILTRYAMSPREVLALSKKCPRFAQRVHFRAVASELTGIELLDPSVDSIVELMDELIRLDATGGELSPEMSTLRLRTLPYDLERAKQYVWDDWLFGAAHPRSLARIDRIEEELHEHYYYEYEARGHLGQTHWYVLSYGDLKPLPDDFENLDEQEWLEMMEAERLGDLSLG